MCCQGVFPRCVPSSDRRGREYLRSHAMCCPKVWSQAVFPACVLGLLVCPRLPKVCSQGVFPRCVPSLCFGLISISVLSALAWFADPEGYFLAQRAGQLYARRCVPATGVQCTSGLCISTLLFTLAPLFLSGAACRLARAVHSLASLPLLPSPCVVCCLAQAHRVLFLLLLLSSRPRSCTWTADAARESAWLRNLKV